MKKGANKEFRGFTIIEVSLVLAVAGLIFLMVFVALPGLRASQRDAERRENVAIFLESVKKFQNNNRGALPTNWNDFKDKYFKDKKDPSGEPYKLEVVDCKGTIDGPCEENELITNTYNNWPNDYRIVVIKQATCKGDQVVGTKNPRKLAILNKLEGAGVYCSNT